ncbi:MAG: 3D domain-containing protein [Oscillospiraceae bacterium]|nr:3D domain-containing protein [Oscillospiraceae bacterium]
MRNGKRILFGLLFGAALIPLLFSGCGSEMPVRSTAEVVTVRVIPGTGDGTSHGEENTFVDFTGTEVPYEKMLTGECTAYTGDMTTSTGAQPQEGVVAVDPAIIPYGTRLYIASADGSIVYGYCVAADTGGAMMDGSALCDLYMDTEEKCTAFGRQIMCVYFLD